MRCLFEDFFKRLNKVAQTEEVPVMAETLSVEILPYCVTCLKCRNLSYEEILDTNEIPLALRYLFTMAKGMQSVIETNIVGLCDLKLLSESELSEKEMYDAIQTVVDNNFNEFHKFYDVIIKRYQEDFHETIDISQIFSEIAGDGLGKLLETNQLTIKHIICQINQLMMHIDFDKSIHFLGETYLRSISCTRRSAFKCSYKLFNDQIGVFGSTLHEGEADYGAYISTKQIFENLKIDTRLSMDDMPNYVIEKKMYKMLIDTIVTNGEIVNHLFELNPAFLKNHCLYAEMIKSSDELDITMFKKALNKIKETCTGGSESEKDEMIFI